MQFSEILKLESLDPIYIKIHMAIGKTNSTEPNIELSNGKFKEWQEIQTKPNFSRPLILSFVYLNKNEWLFAGIYTSGGYSKEINYYHYKTTLTKYFSEYIGKLVITFKKNFRASYLRAENHVDKFEIVEILKKKYVYEPFPGYSNICISYNTLKRICNTEATSWKTALSSVYGIYLITDTKNGKLYVGKADGKDAIWQRWNTYASIGHGNNKDLLKIYNMYGIEYFEHFQFSILEIIIKNNDKEYTDSREAFWKNVLKSKNFGYNEN